MNYLIINGRKSTTVKGLLIQSLPPITKPLMRTEVEEIDGRDGDIVTELGLSAYDREVSIGLYGNYSVDEVIEYFSGSGKVIFSNEKDKYYNFTVVKQIDFEKLIRYRTATVTFHVQPYKYSAPDVPKEYEAKTANVWNGGNTYAMPKITIYGKGNMNLYLNGVLILKIIGIDEYITIDAAALEAYKDDELKNRTVSGNYDDFIFKRGNNTVEIEGGRVEKIVVENYSRWT